MHAPAGAGKSSFLYECVERGLLQGAWYSLSEDDRDPYVFFSYLLAAVDSFYPGVAALARKALEQPAEPDWDAVGTSLINSIFDYGKAMMLVLDDYHLVQHVPIIATMVNKFVRYGSRNFKLVLSTRERPDVALTNLRAKGLLLEMGPEDFLLNHRETIDFFQQGWNIQLDSNLASLLLKKTEGWVTGLQLTAQAISSKSKEEARAYIERLHGQDDVIYHYIASEVFETQPLEVQGFLLATSIVDSFTPELATRLSGVLCPLEMVDYLDRARLFLVHLDARGECFRYHHLFRDFLLRRLAESHEFNLTWLHGAAAEWNLEKQHIVAAIWHFLKSDRVERAVDLLEKEGAAMLLGGLHATFRSQIEILPPALLENRPGLWVHLADLHELEGNWTRAVELYRRCLEAHRGAGAENETAAVLEKLSLVYVKYGETDQLLQVCEEGLLKCSEDSLRSLLSCWLGVALVMSGRDWQRGYDLICESHQLAYRCGNSRAISWACMVYGYVYHLPQGNFSQAAMVLREGIAFFKQVEWPHVITHLSMNLALSYIVEGELEQAQEVVDVTVQNAQESGFTFVVKGLENLRAMVLLEKKEYAAAERCLQEVQKSDIPVQIKPWFFRNQALLLSFLGRNEQSRVARQEMMNALDLNGRGMYAPECLLTIAFLEWREGQTTLALENARLALELSIRAEAKFWKMKSFQVLAAIALASQLWEQTREHLGLAFHLTEANGYYAYWQADPWGLTRSLLEWGQGESLLASTSPLSRILREESIVEIPPSGVQICALGSLEVQRGGISLLPGTYVRPRALLLLKYFLCHPQKLIPTDQLIEQFWPQQPLAQARAALNTHLSLVRKCLGSPAVLARQGDGYRLAGDEEIWLDVRLFRNHVESAAILARSGQAAEAAQAYLLAEKLYRGNFLQDDLYEDFIVHERRRLRSSFETALAYLADLDAQRGFLEQAIERYRRALECEDPREKLLQKLMHCCIASGDKATARQEFEAFKSRSRDASGLCLDRCTGALYRRAVKKNGVVPGMAEGRSSLFR